MCVLPPRAADYMLNNSEVLIETNVQCMSWLLWQSQHFVWHISKVFSGQSTRWHGDDRVQSLHTYHPTMTWSTILLVMRTVLDLTVMLLFVKSCLPTSRSCRTSLSCASSSRGAENGIWRKICKADINEFYHMQQWKYKYNHKYKSPAMELRWNAETKDQMCEYFSTSKSQVSI